MKKSILLAGIALFAVSCQQVSDQTSKAPAPAVTDRDILPADASPISYDISVKPDIASKTFEGEARLTFTVKNKTDRIVVNGINLDIAQALLDDATTARVEIDAPGEKIIFHFDEQLSKGEHHLDVKYAGRLYDNAAGIFISTYPTPEGKKSLLASQLEPGDARKIAPMWDEPAQKAIFKVSAILPEGTMAVSNMPAESATPLGDGFVRTDFQPTPKMSSYLLYFGAGDFDRITQDYNGMELGIITRAGEAEKGRYALNATVDILDYYYDYFGVPYPLPKLDQIAAPGAGGFSAMENWGAILYFEPVLLIDPRFATPSGKQRIFGVVAHEVAHQWFGDLVTMEWWDDLWLNESFASWMDSKISDRLNPDWNVWMQSLRSREYAYSVDSLASTHPISQPVRNMEEATTAFNPAITYAKGEMVIRMIEDYVGEDAFRNGVRAYMKKHQYANTKMDDLWTAIDSASDAPVLDIAHDFTLQPGVPLIVVDSAACNDAGDTTTVNLRQLRFGADTPSKNTPLVWRTPVKAAVTGSDVARATISGPEAQTMTLPGCGAVKLNAGESGYYRTLYSDDVFGALSADFGNLPAVDRLGLLNDSYSLGFTGYAPFSRFLNLVDDTPQNDEAQITLNIVNNLRGLKGLFKDQPGEEQFADYARAWVTPIFAKHGWDATAGETESDAIVRITMIGAMAGLEDADVIAEANRRFAAYLNDPSSLSPEILSTVISIAATYADEATFNQLLDRTKNADNPREQRLLYGALSNVKDEALARRAMEFFLSDEVSPQFRPRYFRSLASDHPRMIWDYYVANFEKIEADLDPLERIEYAAGLASSTGDETIGEELKAFAAKNLPESSKKSVDRAVQFLQLRASIKRERLPEVVEWLEARN